MRWLRILAVTAAALLMSSTPPPSPAGATTDPAVAGKWSAPIRVGVVGIHAALLHTGEVLLWETPRNHPGSEAHLYNPTTGENLDVSLDVKRNVFCAGSTILADGRVLVAGGMKPSPSTAGSSNLTLFDPLTRSWSIGPSMAAQRYYPTTTELPDGRVLIFNGSRQGFGFRPEPQMEVFDPVSMEVATLPHSADTDSALYSKAFVLSDGRVFRAGPQTDTPVFDPGSNRWASLGAMQHGDRPGGVAALLPDGHSVLIAGGGFTATDTAEVIDLSAPTPRWRYTGLTKRPRSEFNLVLLPDETLLAVGGGRAGGFYRLPYREAELYDPTTGTWRLMASQRAQRTYHSTAVLLPDGRVLSAGSDYGSLADTVELYSPPYLFRGPRPSISGAPTSVGYGETFAVATPDGADITRVALIRPSSVTHASDFDQRSVDLTFQVEPGGLRIDAPSSPNPAPPGYYMLFVVNSMGVPAVAPFVHVA